MHIFGVALLAATVWSDASFIEPSEEAIREAFASDLTQGVQAVLSYVAEAGGEAALARIREAHTDAFDIRSFRKGACLPSEERPGHICDFTVEVGTVAGPIEQRTGHADFPHPALGQDFTPSPTARHARARSDVQVRSARTGARVDTSRPCVA